MFRNYIRIAWRNFAKHKIYTVINLLGLTLGICACMVIYMIVSYDFSFDSFHPDKQRIFRIVEKIQRNDDEMEFRSGFITDLVNFENKIPGFEATAGFHPYAGHITIPSDGNTPAKQFDGTIPSQREASIFTSNQYFDIFHYKWLVGNAKTALSDPNKVVLTENTAHKYFGEGSLDNMIGRTVIFNDSLKVTVSGIIEDWNEHTNFGFGNFISISSATTSFLKKDIPSADWNGKGSQSFVKLEKGTNAAEINERFAEFIRSQVKYELSWKRLTVRLQPLNMIHFTDDLHRKDDGDPFYKPYLPSLYALMGLALFILFLGVTNFINLSTAQSICRTKEVGIRKVMGGSKIELTLQFLTETLALAIIAMLCSAIMLKPAVFLFKDFMPDGFEFHFFNRLIIGFLLLITAVTAFSAGFYPARVLSSYAPAWNLKGLTTRQGSSGPPLRKGLIIFQFSISLVFIFAAIVIGSQLQFMRNTDKGFNSDAILLVNNRSENSRKIKLFAESIKHISGVENVIPQGNSPMGRGHGDDKLQYKGNKVIEIPVFAEMGNEDFIPFYNMKIVAGRNMMHSDSLSELVINQTCARAIGFANPNEAVGKLLYRGNNAYPIVGVVADFHEISFHDAIRPDVIENIPARELGLGIKLATTGKNVHDAKTIISEIEQYWKQICPETPFNARFMDEEIGRLFKQDEKTASLVNIAMIITIFISCLGLFGLALFSAEKKSKEIAIRKILGAGFFNIFILLGKEFANLTIIAIVIASPIAWYFMEQWLSDFVYRVSIGWWVFVLSGFIAMLITICTISYQTIRAAIANPVKNLKAE